MRRWHAERDLMLRRWRQELAEHSYEGVIVTRRVYPRFAMAPPSYACNVSCHCANGPGTMRKVRLGCGCAMCKPWKHGWGPFRSTEKRKAIEFELTA